MGNTVGGRALEAAAMSLGRFGGVYAALDAGLEVADMWVQTGNQASNKGEKGWKGRRACVAHVATLTVTQGVFLGLACAATGQRLNVRRTAAGLALNAVSHYVADRRTPLADKLAWAGKDEFYSLGQPPLATGARALDCAWHKGFNAITAAIIAGSARTSATPTWPNQPLRHQAAASPQKGTRP